MNFLKTQPAKTRFSSFLIENFSPKRKLKLKFFAGFLAGILSFGISFAQITVGGSTVPNSMSDLKDLFLNSSYYSTQLSSGGGVAPAGMPDLYYNYLQNWEHFTNVTAGGLEEKSAKASPTSPYVFADEFNTIVGAMRGIFNRQNADGTHAFGLNNEPAPGVTLDVNGSLQLGNFAGFPTTAVAGTLIYHDTGVSGSHFFYYNGTAWRPLDTPACNSCNTTYYEYTCTDDNNGDLLGVWVQNTDTNNNPVTCNSANYDASITYDSNLNDSDGILSVVCAAPTPSNANCTITGAGVNTCTAKVSHYETRCDGGSVYWFDDCGNKNDLVTLCSTGCEQILATDTNGNDIPLPDGVGGCMCSNGSYPTPPSGNDGTCTQDSDCSWASSACGGGSEGSETSATATCNVDHPMHPQYTNGQQCAQDEVGCGTGSNWSDPYPNDNYYSARNPNKKIAGICSGYLCGTATGTITCSEPSASVSSGVVPNNTDASNQPPYPPFQRGTQ